MKGVNAMYTQIKDTLVEAYDFDTGKFIGEAKFTPTISAENSLLDWFNYGTLPKSLPMIKSNFQPSENYVPIIPNETYHQKGMFKAKIKDGYTDKWVSVEVPISYDWKSRSPEAGNYINSVEFINIKQNGPIEITY